MIRAPNWGIAQGPKARQWWVVFNQGTHLQPRNNVLTPPRKLFYLYTPQRFLYGYRKKKKVETPILS
jgi:hypothetical protein